jgi:hypothetical protein
MPECLLSETQRELLRFISRGLEAGVVKRVLRIQVDGAERVTSIVGISDGEMSMTCDHFGGQTYN